MAQSLNYHNDSCKHCLVMSLETNTEILATNNSMSLAVTMNLNQLTSKVDGGITGSRLRWSILT